MRQQRVTLIPIDTLLPPRNTREWAAKEFINTDFIKAKTQYDLWSTRLDSVIRMQKEALELGLSLGHTESMKRTAELHCRSYRHEYMNLRIMNECPIAHEDKARDRCLTCPVQDYCRKPYGGLFD